jgi:surface carbohydrate biosynthesis protein
VVSDSNISKVANDWLKKIIILISIVRYSAFYFSLPKKTTVLIYRKGTSSHIIDFFNDEHTETLEVLTEGVNLIVLLMSLIKRTGYYDEYIQIVNPRLLITFDDNDLKFMGILPPPNCLKIMIQNGFRSALADIFFELHNNQVRTKNLYVDYACMFGEGVSKELAKYVKGGSLIIGSLRNNKVEVCNTNKKKEVLLISTFRMQYLTPDVEISKNVTWFEYNNNRERLFKWLNEFCKKENLKLNILGASEAHSSSEYNYFKKLLPCNSFTFHKRTPDRETYSFTDNFEAIVSVDSSLGYEVLARGGKVAMFGGIIGKSYPLSTRRYGWPNDLPNSGYFWTDSLNSNDWESLLSYTLNTGKEEWDKNCQQYIEKSVVYDYGNTKLISLLRKLDAPLNEKYLDDSQNR